MQAPATSMSMSMSIACTCLVPSHTRLKHLPLPALLPSHCCHANSVVSPNRAPFAAFASLGFTAEPRIGIERAANGLLKDAASLLLYQEVLRTPPAQAFLKVILALRRGEDGWKLLEAYGEFYKLMASGNHSSWEDLVLEGILVGEGNPFSEASANVGNPRKDHFRGVSPSLRAGAAADLDSLQRLSITESTLVGWVTDLVPDVRPEWRVAAESNLSSRNIRKASIGVVDERDTKRGLTFLRSEDLSNRLENIEKSKENVLFENFEMDAAAGSATFGTTDHASRELWRKRIGGLWRWSEAVPLLEKYYAEFGIGRTACTQALQCKGGKLLEDSNFYTFNSNWNLSVHQAHREKLTEAFGKHASQSAALHILVCGPSGSGKTWLVKSALYNLVREGKIRVVSMPKNELKHLRGVVEELARYWQLRFVLVADDLPETDDLVHMEWPENVLLCVTSLFPTSYKGTQESETKKNHSSNVFNDIFGMVLTLESLDLDSYLICVQEILKSKEKNAAMTQVDGIQESFRQQAVSWTKEREVLSLRTAAQFVKSIL